MQDEFKNLVTERTAGKKYLRWIISLLKIILSTIFQNVIKVTLKVTCDANTLQELYRHI